VLQGSVGNRVIEVDGEHRSLAGDGPLDVAEHIGGGIAGGLPTAGALCLSTV
jgi:hypothetical protein